MLRFSLPVYSAYSFHANPNVHEMNKRLPFYLYALLVFYSIFIPKLVFLSFGISTAFFQQIFVASLGMARHQNEHHSSMVVSMTHRIHVFPAL